MGRTRRAFLAGTAGLAALAATGCAGTLAKPGDHSRRRDMATAGPGDGNLTVPVSSPFGAAVLLVAVPAVVGPPVLRGFRRREGVLA